MELMGSVKTVLDIWRDCLYAYVKAIVTDEDSTTRSKLSHSRLEMVAAGRMTETERPADTLQRKKEILENKTGQG
jgi:hypothetical protein